MTKNKKESDIPSITLTGISADSVIAGSNLAIYFQFNFKDGDGDLGVNPSFGQYDIYTTDLRTNEKINYYFPQDLSSNIDASKGVSGQCNLELNAAFMLLRPDRPLGDTVQYELYIKDKSGKESNRITSPKIYLFP